MLYSPECVERLYEKSSNSDEPPRHEANHGSVHQRFAARIKSLVIFAHPPCILVLVVHNAANMGATDRFLLGPGFAETAEQHPSSRPSFGGARTVARANALALLSKPESTRPGLHQQEGSAIQ